MKRIFTYILLPLMILLGFSSCIKDTYTRYEDNIIGTWSFQKVTKNTTVATGRNDLTHLWDMYEITFYENGDAEMYDRDKDSYSRGSWTLSEVVGSNADGSTYEYVINLSVLDRGQIKQYSWQVRMATRDKLRLMEYYNYDYYYYLLDRIY